ncbi:MAG: hypothetical protein KJZ83_09190 [Burkholderiaceae bacterium]|nr:hypothetical protein [Burkholderiaceae bacterium]
MAALESLQVTLLSDGDRATADLSLEGDLTQGGAYVYALEMHAGLEYRFGTAAVEGPAAEHVILVDRSSGDIVWGSSTALRGFGFEPQRAAELASEALEVDARGSYLLILWSAAPPAGQEPLTESFRIEASADAPAFSGNAVYRFFDTQMQVQRLTASIEVRDQLLAERPDIRYDGEVFFGSDKPGEGLIPVFEVLDYHTGSRFYTADLAERDALIEASPSRVDQGAVIYVPDEPGPDTIPLYKLANLDSGALFLTSNLNERLYLLLQGNWADQGTAFDVLAAPPAQPAADSAASQSPADVAIIGVSDPEPSAFS